MSEQLKKLAISVMIVFVAAALLAGCGKKGRLEPPEDGTEYPRTYPSR